MPISTPTEKISSRINKSLIYQWLVRGVYASEVNETDFEHESQNKTSEPTTFILDCDKKHRAVLWCTLFYHTVSKQGFTQLPKEDTLAYTDSSNKLIIFFNLTINSISQYITKPKFNILMKSGVKQLRLLSSFRCPLQGSSADHLLSVHPVP